MNNIDNQITLNTFEKVATRGNLPVERSGQRIFANEDFIFLIGGYNPNPERTLSDAWRFNRLTHEWQQCVLADPLNGQLPDTLASFSLVSRDFNCGSSEAYIFGGTKVPFGGASNTNRLYWIKIDAEGKIHIQNQIVAGVEGLPRIYGQGMCRRLERNNRGRIREVIYIIGGTTGHEYNMDVWKLQRSVNANLNDHWDLTRLNIHNPDQIGRYRLELVPYGQKLYTFGGSISDQFFVKFDELAVFNLDAKEFERVPTKPDQQHGYPQARSCHALVYSGKDVYLLGGRDMEMNIFAAVWHFDLDTSQWTQLPTGLTIPVFFNSATLTPDGCIFVFGGVTVDEHRQNTRVNDLQRMWLAPPSLKYFASQQALKSIFTNQPALPASTSSVRLSNPLLGIAT